MRAFIRKSTVCIVRTNVDETGYWVPKPIDVTRLDLPLEIMAVVEKFAEHFHDSWASRKVGFQ